jgi:regulatory protein YycH of two-component signal transduction system YycFG
MSSIASGLNKLGKSTSLRKNLGKSISTKSNKKQKNHKSTSKPRKLSQKRAIAEQLSQPRLSQRLFSGKSHLDFFTSSQANLPHYSSAVKKSAYDTAFPLSRDMQTLMKRIKINSAQKKPHSTLHLCDLQEKSTSSRRRKQLIKFKFEPKLKQGLLDPEFLSSDNKHRFSKLSPRSNFGSLLKKLKQTCQESDY